MNRSLPTAPRPMPPIRLLSSPVPCLSLLLLPLLLAAVLMWPQRARAQPGEPVPPAMTLAGALAISDQQPVQAVPLAPGETIVLDGTLSHPAWQRAPVMDRFTEKDPVSGAAPKYVTRVQVLFDAAAIYVGITALDDHPDQIRGPLVRHDAVRRTQDYVTVMIDAIGKRQSAQYFRVNAGGSTGDGMYTGADDNENDAPDFDFDAASARNEQGWTAVFRIPFASLRFTANPNAGNRNGWRILVVRRAPREQFYLWTSVPVPGDAPNFLATMQPLQGIQLPDSPTFLSVRPSVTMRRSSSADSGQPASHQSALEGSLDIKWRPLPELVVDGTLKPDFSQVALDVPQLTGNSSFALYLPEKRPFFFESSDLLRSPTEALYTRSFTAPNWGLRSTWRGPSLSGAFFLVDDKGGGTTLLPNAYGTDSATQPGSRSFAARVHGDGIEGGSLDLGGLLALRRYDAHGGDNAVAGPDLNWQVSDAWHLKSQWLHSQTTARYDPTRGGLAQGPASTGDFFMAAAGRYTNESSLDFNVTDSSPGFRHDTGFFNQVGIREWDMHQGLGWHQLGPLNELWLNLNEGQTRERVGSEVINQYLQPNIYIGGPHDIGWGLDYHGLSDTRTAPGHALLHENYWHTYFRISPSPRIGRIETNLSLGRMVDYTADQARPGGQWDMSMQLRPLRSLEVEPSVWMAWLNRDGVKTYRESATQVLAVWHLDARQNLRLIVQRSSFDRKAEADRSVSASRDSGNIASLTYTWRRSMGTVLYVGVTHNRSGVGALTRGSEAFVKLQADFDEARRLLF